MEGIQREKATIAGLRMEGTGCLQEPQELPGDGTSDLGPRVLHSANDRVTVEAVSHQSPQSRTQPCDTWISAS